MLKCSVNPIINPNPVYIHSICVTILIILFTYTLVYKQCWIKSIIFRNVTSCGQVQVYLRFRETSYLHIQHRWVIQARQATNNGKASKQFRVSFISGIGSYAASITVFESWYLETEVCTYITHALLQRVVFDCILNTMQDRRNRFCSNYGYLGFSYVATHSHSSKLSWQVRLLMSSKSACTTTLTGRLY
jgi:hypothetical protein